MGLVFIMHPQSVPEVPLHFHQKKTIFLYQFLATKQTEIQSMKSKLPTNKVCSVLYTQTNFFTTAEKVQKEQVVYRSVISLYGCCELSPQ